MSVRIYQLAKELQKDSKEVLELLKSRGFAVSTVSSTISNIDAEAFLEEFAPRKKEVIVSNKKKPLPEVEHKGLVKEESAPLVVPQPKLPPIGQSLAPERLVKNREEIERERVQQQPFFSPRALPGPRDRRYAPFCRVQR